MRFKVLGGRYIDNSGKKYSRGDIVVSNTDLSVLFRNKFERIPEAVQPVQEAKTEPISPPPTEEGDKDEKSESPSSLEEQYGNDVTDDFEEAEDIGVKVFEHKKWYVVIDEDGGEMLNDKKLRKEGVKEFFEMLVGDSNEE